MTKLYRKHANSLIQRNIGDECVIVNTRSGNIHQLNPVAACIWHKLEEDMGLESLAAILVEEFTVDAETALRDAEAFVTELRNLELIEEL
jgi:hypothetical protein